MTACQMTTAPVVSRPKRTKLNTIFWRGGRRWARLTTPPTSAAEHQQLRAAEVEPHHQREFHQGPTDRVGPQAHPDRAQLSASQKPTESSDHPGKRGRCPKLRLQRAATGQIDHDRAAATSQGYERPRSHALLVSDMAQSQELIVSQVLPSQVFPSQVFPSQVFPSQVFPSQVFPSQVFPSQVFPSQVLPVPRVPVPEVPVPAHGRPSLSAASGTERRRAPAVTGPRDTHPARRRPRRTAALLAVAQAASVPRRAQDVLLVVENGFRCARRGSRRGRLRATRCPVRPGRSACRSAQARGWRPGRSARRHHGRQCPRSGIGVAVFLSSAFTWSGLRFGRSWRSCATAPDTNAAAWDVPLPLNRSSPTRASEYPAST